MTTLLSGPAFERPLGAAQNLADFISARVEQNPEIRCIEVNEAGKQVSRTLAELHGRALEILPTLRERATAGESDIVLCFESALDFVPAAWACIYGGYTCLPWHLAKGPGRGQEVRSRLEAIGQKLDNPVLVTTDDIESRLVCRDSSPFQAAISIDRNLLDQSGPVSPAEMRTLPKAIDDRHAGFLISTSGTTAAAKFAVIDNQCLLNRFLALQEQLSKQVRIFCYPFDGTAGLQVVYPGLADRIYLQPGRLAAQPMELLKLVEQFQLKGFGISSSVLAQILDAAERCQKRPDLSSLEHVALGAELIVPDTVRKLGRQFRQMGATDLKVWFGYGMTETGGICWTEKLSIDQAVGPLDGRGGPVSVGPCVSGWSLRIVDDEGRPLSPETAGNIEVWSDTQLFAGYKNDRELTAQSFTHDGWFKTGDIGVVHGGALTLTGRQKATIIVNARKFSLESIEAPILHMEGIRRSLVAAAAVRRDTSSTDELAVFFVPRNSEKTELDGICRRILNEIGQHAGIPVKYLVPVNESAFPLTTTGKVRRDELVRLYQSGVLLPHVLARSDNSSASLAPTETERWLADLWKKVLKLEFLPSRDESFFDLGGDSLASAELIFAVEERFSCELLVEAFFRHPTIATLGNLVEQCDTATLSKSLARSTDEGYRLLHKLQSYTGSWPGERLFAGSLVVGHNCSGRRTPIFWICQEREEFLQLAKHLGPDQPLYGMRSCVGIVSVKDYSADVIETVCNRYLWEILALSVKAPFVVGGNCQGGIFALALARRLSQIGRTPSPLILMEWTYSYGRYTEPTLLLYGELSHTAEIYLKVGRRAPNWREDFPQRTVASIPGAHGQFFKDENIGGLAEILRSHVSPTLDVNLV